MVLKFAELTDNVKRVFTPAEGMSGSAEENYKAFRKLCYDLNHGNEIFEYDDEGNCRKISKHEANKAVRKIIMSICGLNEESIKSNKRRKRAVKAHINEIFELLEEDIDFKVATGFKDSEWFQDYVDMRNLALGDDEEYWTKEDIMLVVSELSGDNHDITLQYLNEGTSSRVHTKHYGMKVGKDIDLIVLGRIDFTEFTDKVAEAFAKKVIDMCFAGIYAAADKLPNNTQFVKTGALSSSTKTAFDTLLSDVAMANDAEVVIMGTKVALKNINKLVEPGTGAVDWRSESQKEQVANLGRLGSYESTEMVEIPQRFVKNDVTSKLVSDNVLLIFAKTQDKFVRFTDVGETEITERGQEKGDLADDFQTYEVQREFGVNVILPQYFGEWKLS